MSDSSARPTAWKLAVLGALYLSQGLPYGFFVQALPALLRRQGLSLGAIGLSSLLAVPWGLKFLWSPAADRISAPRFGRRKAWIVPAQLCSIAALLALAATSLTAALPLVLALVLLSNAMTATQDIATDGLSFDLMRREERSLANGVKVAAYRGGMILGGGALLWLYDRIGWRGAHLLMAALIALASAPLLLLREPPPPPLPARRAPLFGFFARPQAARILAVLLSYKLGDAFSTGVLRPFFVDLGLDLAQIGFLIGTVGFLAGLLGAFTGGALVNRLGRRRALVSFALLQAAAVAGYALLTVLPRTPALHALVCGCEHFASGMATAALFTCMMDWSRAETAATDYSIQASAVVLATLAASALSGWSADLLGYRRHFVLATLFACASALVAVRRFPLEDAR